MPVLPNLLDCLLPSDSWLSHSGYSVWGSWTPQVMLGPLHMRTHSVTTPFFSWLASKEFSPSTVHANSTLLLLLGTFLFFQGNDLLTYCGFHLLPYYLASLFRMQILQRWTHCLLSSLLDTLKQCLARSRYWIDEYIPLLDRLVG